MNTLEERIRHHAREQGAALVNVAGPGRFEGPPSLDPAYTLRGAKSIVSLAIPMDVPAIYDFLTKRTPAPHNIDQTMGNQRMHHLAARVAAFLQGQGFRARVVPTNNSYRRSPDPFATHPSFSHRFGAIVSGLGGQGLSGNVMTKEYGAAVFLGTVVTDAELKSDEALPPRYFMDGVCAKCRVCAYSCPARMFLTDEEESLLLNGELHPRGKRRSIEFCNASCFGLHGLSLDKAWSSWGRHWISGWVANDPDPRKENIRLTLLRKGSNVGDSSVRYDLIRRIGYTRYPEDWIKNRRLVPQVEDLPTDELEQRAIQSAKYKMCLGLDIDDPNVLTCGHCALVCGPTMAESAKRLRMLREGGIVVRDAGGRTVIVKSFDEAQRIRREHPERVSWWHRRSDMLRAGFLWLRLYGGIEPRSIIQDWRYRRRLGTALKSELRRNP